MRTAITKSIKWVFFIMAINTMCAGPVTFTYSGTVTNDPFGVFGSATFTGQYTFDSNTPEVLNTANSGGYAGAGGIFAMSVVFAGTAGGALDGVPFVADMLNISVNNDFPGPLDQYLVTGTSSTDPNLSIELTLNDFTGTAFNNTLLPLSPPNLANFSDPEFAFFGGTVDNPLEAEGVLTSLGVGAAPVPEPSNAALLSAGLAMVACLLRFQLIRRINAPA
jgi:hypothetical protein